MREAVLVVIFVLALIGFSIVILVALDNHVFETRTKPARALFVEQCVQAGSQAPVCEMAARTAVRH